MNKWPAIFRWNAFTLWNTRHERRLPYWSGRRLEEVQDRRFREIVHFARRHVPFYRETIDSLGLSQSDLHRARDLTKLPIIDKTKVLQSPERFSPPGMTGANGLRLRSSGTSGRSSSIHYTPEALFLALAHGQRQRHVLEKFVGRSTGYRETMLVRSNSVHEQIREYYESYSRVPKRVDLERQFLIMDTSHLERQVSEINEFGPHVIRGYGSYLGAFFRQVLKRDLSLKAPKVVVYGADRMPTADRALIESEFGIAVVSTYQAVEALRIGYECEYRRGFHLFMDDVAVRVVDDDGRDVEAGGRGHIVISNLTNRATVLLNYRLGDIVTLAGAPCSCGRELPMIENIEGRSDDLIALPGGDPMHGLALMGRLQKVSGVVQLQLLQETIDRFTISAVAETDADKQSLESVLVDTMRSTVGDVSVVLNWVDDLPRSPSGKVKAVVSRCTN